MAIATTSNQAIQSAKRKIVIENITALLRHFLKRITHQRLVELFNMAVLITFDDFVIEHFQWTV
jgi:hypothetical protein